MTNQIICPECGSDEVHMLAFSEFNDNTYDCQNQSCFYQWAPGDDLQQGSPKYPEIEVQLTGKDGNAFFILGTVSRALRKANLSEGEVKEFNDEATSGDHNNLLRTCMKWVTVT